MARAETRVIHLWEGGPPGFESRRHEPEQAKDWWVRNVHQPSLTVFKPPRRKANGCAVLVAPGGGFRELVFGPEGERPAEFLSQLGVTAFALKYRLPQADHSPYTIDSVRQDAYRAMRLVRSRAREFEVDADRIGMLGFSAGGALVMLVAFAPGEGNPLAPDPIDRVNGRPNFQMLVYPGGPLPSEVPPGSPPAFLVCANDDDAGCDQITVELLQKLRAARVPVEAHLLARGKHAFNMGDRSQFAAVKHWPERMADWLADSGYL